MNIKTFTIIAIESFAVLSVTACGGKQKASIETEQTEETSKTEVIVSDNKLFINSDSVSYTHLFACPRSIRRISEARVCIVAISSSLSFRLFPVSWFIQSKTIWAC